MCSFLVLILLLSLSVSGTSNRLTGLPSELINLISSYSSNDDLRTLSQVPGLSGDVAIANQYLKKIHDACYSDNVMIDDYYDVYITERPSRKCISAISANRIAVRNLAGNFKLPLGNDTISTLRILLFTDLKLMIRGSSLRSANLSSLVHDAILFPRNRLSSLFIKFENLENASSEHALTLIKMLGESSNNRIRKFSLRSPGILSGKVVGQSITEMKHLNELDINVDWNRRGQKEEWVNFVKAVWSIVPKLKKWNNPFGFLSKILSIMKAKNESFALEELTFFFASLESARWSKSFANLCHLLQNSRKLKTFQLSIMDTTSLFTVQEARTLGSILATLPAIENIVLIIRSMSGARAVEQEIEFSLVHEIREILPRLKRLESSCRSKSSDFPIQNGFFKLVERLNLEALDLELRVEKSISTSLNQYTDLIRKCDHLKSIVIKWPTGINFVVPNILPLAEAIGSRLELKHVIVNHVKSRNLLVNIMGQSIMQRMWPCFYKLWTWHEDFTDYGRLGLFWSAMRMLKTTDRPESYSFRRIKLSLPGFYTEILDKKAMKNFLHLLKNSPDLQQVTILTGNSKYFDVYLEEITRFLPMNIRLKIESSNNVDYLNLGNLLD